MSDRQGIRIFISCCDSSKRSRRISSSLALSLSFFHLYLFIFNFFYSSGIFLVPFSTGFVYSDPNCRTGLGRHEVHSRNASRSTKLCPSVPRCYDAQATKKNVAKSNEKILLTERDVRRAVYEGRRKNKCNKWGYVNNSPFKGNLSAIYFFNTLMLLRSLTIFYGWTNKFER